MFKLLHSVHIIARYSYCGINNRFLYNIWNVLKSACANGIFLSALFQLYFGLSDLGF